MAILALGGPALYFQLALMTVVSHDTSPTRAGKKTQ